ncbi:sulfotransferase domain-containing protein [Oceanibacterium hippocampi]|uniref:Sulfotransferase domain protein n=1 Tax=Oceanibacterium hippocampi TaxID=745714 RepID=A0A1Y5TXJ4_9PROT|nr:sulfotransferase domain-containing protein [Oceanibacterium hippocampi]SLN76228.1 Sulfotransferase domain protein [Oceanibacterium hippocampi]
MHVLLKKLTRELTLLLLFFLPKARKIRIERWLRGREEARKLRLADGVVVSFGKSGRTWLRVMISRFYQVKHGLAERHLIGFDNLHRKNAAIPKLFFTHDNYLKDYTGNAASKADYYDSKVVLLVRNPADVAVSQYFQWKFRMRPAKKALNDYPAHNAEIEPFDFVMDENAGLPKIIDWMNLWAREAPRINGLYIMRYEDMRTDAERELARLVEFLGTPGSAEEVKEAVAFSSVDNMRKMEEKRTFWLSGSRMVAKDKSNPNSYKVRRAKVGGFRDYFSDEQIAAIEAMVHDRLDPAFGYQDAKLKQAVT